MQLIANLIRKAMRNQSAVSEKDLPGSALTETGAGIETSNAIQNDVESCHPDNSDTERFRADVANCLPAFSVIAAQLNESIAFVEQAVESVCGDFHNISRRANEVVSQTERVAENPENIDIGKVLDTNRNTLDKLLQQIDGEGQRSSQAVQTIAGLASEFEQIKTNLKQIDEVADQAKVVAINGRIESARFHTGQNDAFGVVAQETAELAGNSRSIAKSIRTIVERMDQSLVTVTHELKSNADVVRAQSTKTKGEIIETLGLLESAHDQMKQTCSRYVDLRNEMVQDISRCVMAMQFQDALSQRVGHLVDVIQGISDTIEMHLGDHRQSVPSNENRWLLQLAKSYMMNSERRVHEGHSAETLEDEVSDDNVELF